MKLRADTVTQAVPPLGRPILLRATLMHSRRSSSTFSFFRLLRALLDPRDIQSAVAPHWEMTSIAVIDTLVRYVRVLQHGPSPEQECPSQHRVQWVGHLLRDRQLRCGAYRPRLGFRITRGCTISGAFPSTRQHPWGPRSRDDQGQKTSLNWVTRVESEDVWLRKLRGGR